MSFSSRASVVMHTFFAATANGARPQDVRRFFKYRTYMYDNWSNQARVARTMKDQSKVVAEFPRKFLTLLRCSRDAGELIVAEERKIGEVGLIEATLRCQKCSSEYSIENGIARLMTNSLSAETQHEIALKDADYEIENFVAETDDWRSEYMDALEIPSHLDEMAVFEGCRVLELACGDGRFTILMAQMGAEVLAVDFSYSGLRRLAHNLSFGVAPTSYRHKFHPVGTPLAGRVALVQADVSALHLAPSSFDRALSATPCDSRNERMKMYQTVADSLKEGGRYIAGVEYDDLNRRLLGLPVLRRYTPGGVLIEHLTAEGLNRELMPYFSRVKLRPIRVKLPLVRKMPQKQKIFLARAAEHIPVLKEFGEIVLARAERPIRLPQEDRRRAGSPLVRNFYRWYKRSRGQAPVWDAGVAV